MFYPSICAISSFFLTTALRFNMLPVYTGFHNEKLGDMFPILFVTVACGAGAAASADGTAATGTPFQIFSAGVAGFLEMFGIPVHIAQCIMTMCVSALALSTLDSVARIGRMSFQELVPSVNHHALCYLHRTC